MASPLRLPILWALAVADVTTTLIIPGACQFQAVNHSTYCFGCCKLPPVCTSLSRCVKQFAWVWHAECQIPPCVKLWQKTIAKLTPWTSLVWREIPGWTCRNIYHRSWAIYGNIIYIYIYIHPSYPSLSPSLSLSLSFSYYIYIYTRIVCSCMFSAYVPGLSNLLRRWECRWTKWWRIFWRPPHRSRNIFRLTKAENLGLVGHLLKTRPGRESTWMRSTMRSMINCCWAIFWIASLQGGAP